MKVLWVTALVWGSLAIAETEIPYPVLFSSPYPTGAHYVAGHNASKRSFSNVPGWTLSPDQSHFMIDERGLRGDLVEMFGTEYNGRQYIHQSPTRSGETVYMYPQDLMPHGDGNLHVVYTTTGALNHYDAEKGYDPKHSLVVLSLDRQAKTIGEPLTISLQQLGIADNATDAFWGARLMESTSLGTPPQLYLAVRTGSNSVKVLKLQKDANGLSVDAGFGKEGSGYVELPNHIRNLYGIIPTQDGRILTVEGGWYHDRDGFPDARHYNPIFLRALSPAEGFIKSFGKNGLANPNVNLGESITSHPSSREGFAVIQSPAGEVNLHHFQQPEPGSKLVETSYSMSENGLFTKQGTRSPEKLPQALSLHDGSGSTKIDYGVNIHSVPEALIAGSFSDESGGKGYVVGSLRGPLIQMGDLSCARALRSLRTNSEQ